jgi:DNA repair protein RadA/Sms
MKCHACQSKLPEGKYWCPKCGKRNFISGLEQEVYRLSDIADTEEDRLHTGPWDLAFGGGMVKDSVTFLAGHPGAGKSSFLLLVASALAAQGLETLYLGKEETLRKVRNRANRFGIPEELQTRIHITRTMNGSIVDLLEHTRPSLLIVDSLPALVGLGWKDVSEAEEILTMIKEYAVANLCPAIVVDHINRRGEFSGPIALEHLIDITMMMKKDKVDKNLRRLVPDKSRDGSVDVQVCFQMTAKGLVWVEPPLEIDEENDDGIEDLDGP